MVRIGLGSDINPQLVIPLLGVILAIYTLSTIPELQDPKDWPDYDFFKIQVAEWQPIDATKSYGFHVKYGLGKISTDVFGNHKIVPLIITLGLVVVSYLFAVQQSGKRYAGLLCVGAILGSSVFRSFDTSAVHSYEWALFFITSLYFIQRKWQLVPLFFVLSILSKPTAVLFLPATIYFVITAPISKAVKITLGTVFAGIIFGLVISSHYYSDYASNGFDSHGFVSGLGAWEYFFMVPDFWLAALMPMSMLLLFVLSIKKVPRAMPILVMMINTAIFGAFLDGLTDDMWNEPYRYAPLIVMFGASLGVIIKQFLVRRESKVRINLGKV